MTKMFYNERTNDEIKDVKVEKLRKTKREKIMLYWGTTNIDGVAYLHHNFETKVEGFEVVKIVTSVSKGVESVWVKQIEASLRSFFSLQLKTQTVFANRGHMVFDPVID
ncbi:unnamed protein product [Trifolium pratense]|uniref:Uncharacterized protein n=1 Tax=Trifolium pratense TaxID=57577 RepID=A0ACB0LN16_TRIPR|nr:unnamed protein product [Trifolium pratense]